jgi:hypothetical protein
MLHAGRVMWAPLALAQTYQHILFWLALRDQKNESQVEETKSMTTQSILEHSYEELQSKAKYVQDSVEGSIQHVRRNRWRNQKRASAIKVATILFSALATVLLGLQIAGTEAYFKQIAFVFGAIVTMLNALEPFYNFRALWVEHELALARLYRIQSDLGFYLSGTKPEGLELKVLEEFQLRNRQAWEELSTAWIGYRKSKELKE